jgi:hypothetical protein
MITIKILIYNYKLLNRQIQQELTRQNDTLSYLIRLKKLPQAKNMPVKC